MFPIIVINSQSRDTVWLGNLFASILFNWTITFYVHAQMFIGWLNYNGEWVYKKNISATRLYKMRINEYRPYFKVGQDHLCKFIFTLYRIISFDSKIALKVDTDCKSLETFHLLALRTLSRLYFFFCCEGLFEMIQTTSSLLPLALISLYSKH